MKIGIVGLGIVGGSLAMGLKNQAEYEIYGLDICPETIAQAKEMGIIKEGSTQSEDILPQVDMVVLALYPVDVAPFVEKNQSLFREGSLLVEFSGIKTYTINSLTGLIPEGVEPVFAHPMAGREKKGLMYASGEVNQGANFIITPIQENHEESLLIVEKLARDAGFGKISRLSPEEHDAMIAYTSQLPHAMAVALVNSDVQVEKTLDYIGDSYRDLTRIASINEDLWSELFLGNREDLLKTITRFETSLEQIKTTLEENDPTALKEIFIESNHRKNSM